MIDLTHVEIVFGMDVGMVVVGVTVFVDRIEHQVDQGQHQDQSYRCCQGAANPRVVITTQRNVGCDVLEARCLLGMVRKARRRRRRNVHSTLFLVDIVVVTAVLRDGLLLLLLMDRWGRRLHSRRRKVRADSFASLDHQGNPFIVTGFVAVLVDGCGSVLSN